MPTNRQDLWTLLQAREGQWVNRDDLNFVGGEDAARRMRDIRKDVERSGQWILDERKDGRHRIEWRLSKIERHTPERLKWACTACGTYPQSYERTMATLDPRWRMAARCWACRVAPAYYQRADS